MSSSKYDQKISPIKMLNSPAVKSFETPAKYLTQRNETIYEEEYYKEKCDRLDKENKELKEHVRIVETQNKELKTQIQYYREQQGSEKQSYQPKSEEPYQYKSEFQHRKDTSTVSFKDEKFLQFDEPKLEEIEKLLKEIRVLKNNHEMEINEYKTEQKRLNKKLLELEDIVHKNELEWQSKCQNAEISVQEKNKQLEKEIKELRKSVVVYMEQRDQNENFLQILKKQIESQNQRISDLSEREKNLQEENAQLEETIKQKDIEAENNMKKHKENERNDEEFDNRASKMKESVYQFGMNSRKDRIRESNFSIHTFNGNRHVLAEEAFEVSESLKSEIYRLEKEIENQEIAHKKDLNDLNFLIERGQKEIKEKEADIVSLLTKVKPLLLEKHKMIAKENLNPDETKKVSFEEAKETVGKNAFGLRMLELYLKKYKLETF